MRRGIGAAVSLLVTITLFVVLPTPSSFSPAASDRIPSGTTYYVSPRGDDANPGTRELPWRNPGWASRRLEPGDTLVILEGEYHLKEYDADILSPPSGKPGAWVTIKGEGRAVLLGSANILCAIELSGRSYVRIENLEITSDGGSPFRDGIQALGGPVSHVVLAGLHIHHLDEFGVDLADAVDLRIMDCTITHCGFGAIGGPRGREGGWREVLIAGCYLAHSGHYYRGGPGPSPYDRPDGFGIEPSAGPVEIRDTVVEHNRGDGIDSKARNTYIRNCIVANNFADGVKLWGPGSRAENTLVYGRGDGSREITPWSAVVIDCEEAGGGFELVNVTVDDLPGGNYLMHVQYDRPDVPVRLLNRNSILSSRGPNAHVFLAPAVEFALDHVLFYTPRSYAVLQHGDAYYGPDEVVGLGAGVFYGDPMFVSPADPGKEGDYRLQEGSPAIDAGTARGAPPYDLLYTPRAQGAGYDLGAYERREG